MARGLHCPAAACGIFPDQGLNPCPLHWQCACAKSLQSCPILCDPVNHSPPGSSVHGILQARTLAWVAIPFFRGSSRPRDRTQVPYIGKWILKHWTAREALQPECESRLCLFLALSDQSICKMRMMILPLVGLLWGLTKRRCITWPALSARELWLLPPLHHCHRGCGPAPASRCHSQCQAMASTCSCSHHQDRCHHTAAVSQRKRHPAYPRKGQGEAEHRVMTRSEDSRLALRVLRVIAF